MAIKKKSATKAVISKSVQPSRIRNVKLSDPTQLPRYVGKQDNRILNCIRSRGAERDWRIAHAAAAGHVEAKDKGKLPTHCDLREAFWEIGNQGDTGSCVGWACGDGVLRWHFVKAGHLEKKERLSVRYIWMASKETDDDVSVATTFIEEEGTSLKTALDVARKHGLVLEKMLPFGGGLYAGKLEDFYLTASRLRIASYFNLENDPDAWRRWISKKGPVFARLEPDENFMNYKKGVLKSYKASTVDGGHAVAIVGYEPGAFYVRNSWGTTWGEKGFARVSDAYVLKAFTEGYGVHVWPGK